MYNDVYSIGLARKLKRLRKKDFRHYTRLRQKMDQIRASPRRSYKYLHYTMKGVNRVHVGHYVLVFVIDHQKKTVSFEDYDHHDKIYR
jgi:mRNA-degrading endonuclease RelE of RelBE toxin-antitoxin system